MLKLCVNIDHIATIRQARGGDEPDPAAAAALCERAGADGVTFHLREDRRHIQDRDIYKIKRLIKRKLNMEMAHVKEIIDIALTLRPHQVTLVPEKRRELTTEGGLDVMARIDHIGETVGLLRKKNIDVSLFIDPDPKQVKASVLTQAKCVELHTGEYANAKTSKSRRDELCRIMIAAAMAHEMGLKVFAGHGLNYKNVQAIRNIPYIEELNIGHSIVSRAVFTGIEEAVREMLKLMK